MASLLSLCKLIVSNFYSNKLRRPSGRRICSLHPQSPFLKGQAHRLIVHRQVLAALQEKALRTLVLKGGLEPLPAVHLQFGKERWFP